MNSTEKAEAQEEKLIPVEAPEEADSHDEGHDDGHDDGDQRLSDSLNDQEQERRMAKREDRRLQKERQRYARDKTRQEMQWLIDQNRQLQQRLEAVEQHAISAQKGSLDQNYNQALYAVRKAEADLAKAIEIGDGAKVPELLRQRDQAMAQAAEINRVKNQFSQQPAPQNNEVAERAQRWAAKNSWFNANGTDPDSLAAKAIDAKLASEGFDPSTKRYWKELDRRLADRLPHRFADEEDSSYTEPQQSGRRSPPVGGSREISAPGSKKVFVSAERIEAMKEAGYWDDPVLRQRMLKRYQEADRENRAAR